MRVGLFGGTFDPVHNGHLAVARAAIARFELDLVYFVPAGVPPHKQDRQLTDFRHRFAMLALATANEKKMVPSLLDAQMTRPSYSIETIRKLKSKLARTDTLYFLIGMDAFQDIATWRHPLEVLSSCEFIVASRPGHSLADLGSVLPELVRPPEDVLRLLREKKASGTIAVRGATIHLLPDVHERASSTQLRGAAQKSVKQLSRYVPVGVADYIKKEHLYTEAALAGKDASHGKVLSFQRAHTRSKPAE